MNDYILEEFHEIIDFAAKKQIDILIKLGPKECSIVLTHNMTNGCFAIYGSSYQDTIKQLVSNREHVFKCLE